MITGLVDSGATEDWWSETARRSICYAFPNGAASLMYLLSLMDDDGGVDKPKPSWFEKRYDTHRSTTAEQAATKGPFQDDAGTELTAGGWSKTSGSEIRVVVADTDRFRKRDMLWVTKVTDSSDDEVILKGIVTAIGTSGSKKYVQMRLVADVTNVRNNADQNGNKIVLVTSVSPEGAGSNPGGMSFPIEPYNYTQIVRTGFEVTGTGLKPGQRFDDEGIMGENALENGRRHMEAMEANVFWGHMGEQIVTNDKGKEVPERTLGGLDYFINQYELGNTDNGGRFDYRPNGDDITGSNWLTEERKRSAIVNGSITKAQWNTMMERAFFDTDDTGYEKLCLCDMGFISVFNEFLDNKIPQRRDLFNNGKAGFNFFSWESPFGIVHFKTHPLFNSHQITRGSGYIIDVGNLKYQHLNDRDTKLRENIQDNDTDAREDEWFTEHTLELKRPETMFKFEGISAITTS